jgi:hypothetical protein
LGFGWQATVFDFGALCDIGHGRRLLLFGIVVLLIVDVYYMVRCADHSAELLCSSASL